MRHIYSTFLLMVLLGSWIGLMNVEVQATNDLTRKNKIEKVDDRTQYKMNYKAIVTELMVAKNAESELLVEMILAYLLPRPIFERNNGYPIEAFSLSPDGKLLFTSGTELTIWSFARGNVLWTHEIYSLICVCSPKKNPYTLVTNGINGHLLIWRVHLIGDPTVVKMDSIEVEVDCRRTLTKSSAVCCFLDDHRFLSGGTKSIHELDIETGTQTRILEWIGQESFRLLAVTGGQDLVAVTLDSMICVTMGTSELKVNLTDPDRMAVSASCMTSDGAYVVVGGEQRLLVVYSPPTMKRVFNVNCAISITACASNIQKGTENHHLLVIGGYNNEYNQEIHVLQWQPGTLNVEQRYIIPNAHESQITAFGFTPEREILISADLYGVIKIWNINSGELHK